MTYSPDGTRLATCWGDTIAIWDVSTGQELLRLPALNEQFWSLAFSPDGRRLATSGPNAPVRVWDISPELPPASSRLLAALPGATDLESGTALAFSPDGTQLAAQSGAINAITVWDANSYTEIMILAGHTGVISDIAFSPDGTRLASISSDQTAKIWDVTPSHDLLTLSGPTGSLIHRVAFSPDGTHLVADTDPAATVWDVTTGEVLFTLTDPDMPTISLTQGNFNFGPVTSVAINPDGTRIATANTGATLELRSDSSVMDVWNETATAAIWDAATGRKLLTLRGHVGAVMDVTFSHNGRWLATASLDGTAIIWDAQTGERLGVALVDPKSYHVVSVAFNPDDSQLATGAEINTNEGIWETEIWNINHSGQPSTKPLTSFKGNANVTAYGPDVRLFAWGNWNTLELWDVSAFASPPRQLGSWFSSGSDVRSVAFSLDGMRLATGFRDGTANIWDISNVSLVRELLLLTGHTHPVNGVAFSPDGTRLATAGADGTVRIYVLPLEDLIVLAKTRVTRSLTDAECVKYLHVEKCPAR
jgi:WD40 repeat protein